MLKIIQKKIGLENFKKWNLDFAYFKDRLKH